LTRIKAFHQACFYGNTCHWCQGELLLLLALLLCMCCQVAWLNRMLDLCHWYLLSTRVMLTQHSAALAELQVGSRPAGGPPGSTGQPASKTAAAAAPAVSHYHEPGHTSTTPNLPYTPPHQQLVSGDRPISLIRRLAPVRELLGTWWRTAGETVAPAAAHAGCLLWRSQLCRARPSQSVLKLDTLLLL